VKRITKPGLILVVFCCVSFARSQSQSPTDSHLFATIDSGMLEGAHFGTARNEVMFLGIPYAAPPTGDRRWKAPQPVEKWPGVRKATSYGRLVLRQKTLRPKS
jgi:carboxylesterase type B